MTSSMELTNPVWASLTAGHACLARRFGHAAGYPEDVSDLHAVAAPGDRRAWADLAALTGPAAVITVPGGPDVPIRGWRVHSRNWAVQLTGERVRAQSDPRVVELTEPDLPDVLGLISRIGAGRVRPRGLVFGRNLGIRRNGILVATAGERMRPPGWTEISFVHVDPAFTGRGFEARLVAAVAHIIEARGERPFLHISATDTKAIRYYGS